MLSSSIRTARHTLKWSGRGSTLCSRLTESKLSPNLISFSKKTISSQTLPNSLSALRKSIFKLNKKELALSGLIAALIAQSFFGSESDFYEYRFIVKRDVDPDDLASFYGSEQFMDIFCMLPIVGQIMMRGGYFDDDGTVHTYGFPGELLVSMAFTDEMNEETGTVDWFNKRERFKNVFLGMKMWDQVSNFGFHTLPDGRIEVYHTGEYFVGWLPIISLGVKIAFQIQARVVAWATEHHLNHRAFIDDTEEDEELEELSRTNHILYFIKYHLWNDLKAMIGLGKEKIENATFLVLEGTDPDEKITLPIKRAKTMARVQESLSMDKELLRKEDFESLPKDNAYRMAQQVAMRKHYTLRVVQRKTTVKEMSNKNVDETKKVITHEVKHPDAETNVEEVTELANEKISDTKDEINESVENIESNSINEEGKDVLKSSVEKDESEMNSEVKKLSNLNSERETESDVLTEEQKSVDKYESKAMDEEGKQTEVDLNVVKDTTEKENERYLDVENTSNWSKDEIKTTEAIGEVVKQLELEPKVEAEVMESLHATSPELKDESNKNEDKTKQDDVQTI